MSEGPVVEITPGRSTQVGSLPVRRVLPQRPRRTVGSWCFLDHAGRCWPSRRGRSASGHTLTWAFRQ